MGMLFSLAQPCSCPSHPLCRCRVLINRYCHMTCGSQNISLTQTDIDQIGRDATMTKVEFLTISYCAEDVISFKKFPTLLKLQSLEVNCSSLLKIPTDLNKLSSLIMLFVSGHKITSIEKGVLFGYRHLETLAINGNIRTIEEETFIYLRNLTTLDLRSNKISILSPNVFAGLEKLKYLTLDHNNIATIPVSALSTLHNLKELQLIDNKITTIPESAVSSLRNLTLLDLDKNPLKCDCELYKSVRSLYKSSKRLVVDGTCKNYTSDHDHLSRDFLTERDYFIVCDYISPCKTKVIVVSKEKRNWFCH